MPDPVNYAEQWTTGDAVVYPEQWGAGGGDGGGSTPEPIGQSIQFEAIAFGSITFTALGDDEDET